MGQLKIVCAQLGPIDTNTYILMDDEIKEAIIIDPAGSPEELIKFLEDEGYSLDGVLLTHGHHDHRHRRRDRLGQDHPDPASQGPLWGKRQRGLPRQLL